MIQLVDWSEIECSTIENNQNSPTLLSYGFKPYCFQTHFVHHSNYPFPVKNNHSGTLPFLIGYNTFLVLGVGSVVSEVFGVVSLLTLSSIEPLGIFYQISLLLTAEAMIFL